MSWIYYLLFTGRYVLATAALNSIHKSGFGALRMTAVKLESSQNVNFLITFKSDYGHFNSWIAVHFNCEMLVTCCLIYLEH